ncbi:MAG: rhomboid family intramembrane serine protease [Pseudomonadota bacterium]
MNHIPKIPRAEDAPRPFRGPPFGGPPYRQPPTREPMFTIPGSVLAMAAILSVIHIIRGTLSFHDDLTVLAWFAFIPARFTSEWAGLPGGIAADVWTFFTYAGLHGSTMHLVTNVIWMVAFGSAVARRFGAWRFWLFSLVTAAGGAGAHLFVHWGDTVPVVGASAAISGQMAAAARFVFDEYGPLSFRFGGEAARYKRPARNLADTLSNKRALTFIIIWFAVNLIVGVGSSVAGGVSIAWEAHLGGFVVGLLAFRLFDPVPR